VLKRLNDTFRGITERRLQFLVRHSLTWQGAEVQILSRLPLGMPESHQRQTGTHRDELDAPGS
jgi:hypothetical protein